MSTTHYQSEKVTYASPLSFVGATRRTASFGRSHSTTVVGKAAFWVLVGVPWLLTIYGVILAVYGFLLSPFGWLFLFWRLHRRAQRKQLHEQQKANRRLDLLGELGLQQLQAAVTQNSHIQYQNGGVQRSHLPQDQLPMPDQRDLSLGHQPISE